MTGIKGVLIKILAFSDRDCSSITGSMLQSGWGWMHEYTNKENTVILQGRHKQNEAQSKAKTEKQRENKQNADLNASTSCCLQAPYQQKIP